MRTVCIFMLITAVIALKTAEAKIFKKCDLVHQLKKHGVPKDEWSDWVCIAKGESSYNTKAINTHNPDGSYDYGIFQINNRYWCKTGSKGHECNIKCEDLLNDDISEDIRCAQLIKKMQGFKAWVAWNKKCNGKPKPDISKC
ncbi:lysozyme c-1-like [Periplaneta americana]|uniref:lysozyme c-1-like n=1 Tax=Periplaneta americana TaxID=6978 RepID=UPI0037E70515